MELTALAGNAQIKAQLAHREGDLAHAYIVAGPAGSGRHTLAAQMAAALVCSAQPQLRPCGRCSHCRKAAGGIHPDITVIAGSGGKPITVDQVRALRTDAYVRPNEAERKVYLLERADRMNASAQNAMLKLLEDGPAYAVFFLLAENGSALLPTVRSRCETLELAPVSPAQAGSGWPRHFPGERRRKSAGPLWSARASWAGPRRCWRAVRRRTDWRRPPAPCPPLWRGKMSWPSSRPPRPWTN